METQVWELCCEAALLSDEAAIAFLSERLETYPSNTDGYGFLLTALAWLDVERALKYYDDSFEGARHMFPRSHLEAYQEAQWLQAYADEQITAYRAVTALLPQRESETIKRQRASGFLCARLMPQQFIGAPNWELCLDFFLLARLYIAFPAEVEDWADAGRDRLGFWRLRFRAMEQTLLVIRQEEGYIQRLVGVLENCCQSAMPLVNSIDAKALYNTLCLLEIHAPEEVRRLAHRIVRMACSGNGYTAAAMLAYLFSLIVRLELDLVCLGPVRDKLLGLPHYKMGRYWLQRVCQLLRELVPEPQSALRLARIFHLYMLASRIEKFISLESVNEVTRKQRDHAHRWLARSQCFIDSVEFPYWREQLQEKLDSLRAEAT